MVKAVGIDLGTSDSVGDVLGRGEPTVIRNPKPSRTIRSVVGVAKRAASDGQLDLIGGAADFVRRRRPVLDAFDADRGHHPEALAPIDGVLQATLCLEVTRIDAAGNRFELAG